MQFGARRVGTSRIVSAKLVYCDFKVILMHHFACDVCVCKCIVYVKCEVFFCWCISGIWQCFWQSLEFAFQLLICCQLDWSQCLWHFVRVSLQIIMNIDGDDVVLVSIHVVFWW